MEREWHAEEILSMGRGFQATCVLVAAAELNLFGRMGGEELTADEVAERLDGDRRGTRVLLDALAALELLGKVEDRYHVPPGALPLLTFGDDERSVLAMIRHQGNCMRRWAQLAFVVKTGVPAVRVPSILGEEADREAFIEAMNDINRAVAPILVEELAILDFEHFLDVGGASGTWTEAWLSAVPDARATLFDLPDVIPLARERLTRDGFAERVRLVAGDFAEDPLPEGADLAWVSAIIHQHSREENRALFSKVFEALEPGGRILIRDIVMEEDHVRPVSGALFAVNMLVATPGGGTFTIGEIREDLESAGFVEVEWTRKDDWMHAIVRARKP
jgi:precorrin-6B methylase 2